MPKKKATRTAKKAAAKVATHQRAPGKTQISISLPEDLVSKIDKLAAADNRNRSNFIATALEAICAESTYTNRHDN